MPFNIPDPTICETCDFGTCVTYIREQSKRMKDRDTQYRLVQKAGMECAFESWIPGFTKSKSYALPFKYFIDQLIQNANGAGKHLEGLTPSRFGDVEEKFLLTPQQLGKVRGDVFQMLSQAILWNCCAYLNMTKTGTDISSIEELPSELLNLKSSHVIAVLTLGDNYDLKKILDGVSRKAMNTYESMLQIYQTRLSYSTPDLICVDISNLPAEIQAPFLRPITSLSSDRQEELTKARELVEGYVRPENILFAAGLKTSIRSDRMYQLLFEANAWKFIWRRVFKTDASAYYAMISEDFGTDPEKLRSLEFTSVDDGPENAVRAIDGVEKIISPKDLISWFTRGLKTAS
jgi:Cfr10I/Bse634I restriction endonuclease